VKVHNDTLSVQLREHDLQSVIRTIASQGQIEVKHLESLPSTRVSMTFTDVPVIVGLKRLLRAADVAGYVLVTGKEGDANKVERLVFVPNDETGGGGGRGAQQRAAAGSSPRTAFTPPMVPPPPQPPPPGQPGAETEEGRQSATPGSSVSVFEDLKTNAAAKRLVSQLMHPNEQVRERAFESLVRLVGEDDKQRELLEFLEPLMEDLASEDRQTQEEARGEIRKLLSQ
jgi:hypothetical protein